jgi:hypothetical protein
MSLFNALYDAKLPAGVTPAAPAGMFSASLQNSNFKTK